jgi:peptidoglycan/xylan/chitin deacetylase (PgdA/CDA1 family)
MLIQNQEQKYDFILAPEYLCNSLMRQNKVEFVDQLSLDKCVFLTLDLECDYGTALEENRYDAATSTDELASLLESFEVPVSCFLQTELIEMCPDAVNNLLIADVPVEMHAHSHTHPDHDDADVTYEVSESLRRVRGEFGTSPIGFRFPDGSFDGTEYQVLADNQVQFSSSVFPSFRPGRFNNLAQPTTPFQHLTSGIVELPFTVFSKYLPVPVALSYLKLIGMPFRTLVDDQPPRVIVFDFHMHDLVVPPAFENLSPLYRGIYTRNKREGFAILSDFINTLQKRGYNFAPISQLYQEVADDLGI